MKQHNYDSRPALAKRDRMNRRSILWIGVALVSILALGLSVTTLDSTVTTEPADAVDVDYDSVPIGAGEAQAFRDEVEGNEPDGSDDGTTGDDGDEHDTGEHVPPDSEGEESEDAGAVAAENDGEAGASGIEEGLGTAAAAPTLLDRLLDLLRSLAELVVMVGVILAVGTLLVRYGDRLFESPGDTEVAAGSPAEPWPTNPPENPVERAWVDLVHRLDLRDPAAMTTSECAAAAVRNGFDADAVDRLTETFEEVSYGNRPVTDERVRRAERCRSQLLGEGEDG